MKHIHPVRNRVLVRTMSKTPEKVGGIIIPEKSNKERLCFEVIAVGSGARNTHGEAIWMPEVGQVVYIDRMAGDPISDELVMIKSEDIIAVIEPNKP
jgi:chaperonin GroES